MKIEDLPQILTAQQISDYLHISRRRVYELMDLQEFPVICIGASKRVDKADFKSWLQAKKKQTIAN